MPLTLEQVIDIQLAAYNAHDIDAFMASYSPTIMTMAFPSNQVYDDSADAMRQFFGKFFVEARPRVEISKRIVRGNFVIDHEMGHDEQNGDWQAVAIYEVIDELIQRVWFVANDNTASG